ncbi:hypothetical protein Li1_0701 [Lactococcus lactis subsp. lactis]|nr:hypothetical protein KF134_1774 [Lactococcus lactis subsp. lactis]KST97540.1 hypothetical protein KF146_0667 [Lactococcus lactis subsp. lactis]KST99644.1 hypothetical protein KF196_0714 [Lactococcus lactis subsp. lactis]KSU08703.1 hypothetical protein Li1_0701 [Lactococcus lactis subsp. lactis]
MKFGGGMLFLNLLEVSETSLSSPKFYRTIVPSPWYLNE